MAGYTVSPNVFQGSEEMMQEVISGPVVVGAKENTVEEVDVGVVVAEVVGAKVVEVDVPLSREVSVDETTSPPLHSQAVGVIPAGQAATALLSCRSSRRAGGFGLGRWSSRATHESSQTQGLS